MQLTNREQEILDLISLEFTTAEIASKLFLSPSTIETHRRKLFIKLDVKNLAGLIRTAFEFNLLEIRQQVA